jgi:DNA/RNA-binding domain of Phe-tRNA-synthetase-like protein
MDMYDLIPYMEKSRTTLCFNWKSNTATTSRYVEAIATGIFPFVWKDYDSTNKLVVDDAQRVWTVDEYFDSLHNKGLEAAFSFIRHMFEKNLPSKQEYAFF